MPIDLQYLDQRFPIVDPKTGQPTDYFLRLLRGQTGTLGEEIETVEGELADKADKAIVLTAGAGLTGGGDLSANRTFAVGAGTGITVNADDVALSNTAVTPGNYTNTDLTVDAQGRITAAANGSGGGGGGYTLIERYTADGTVGTKTFSSLGSYSNLKIIINSRTTAASAEEQVLLRFNGDTGSNYDSQLLAVLSGSTSAAATLGGTSIIAGSAPGASSASGLVGEFEVTIPRYLDTVFHKSLHSAGFSKQNNAAASFRLRLNGGSWRDTSAISSITIFLAAGNYVTGSVIEVWGY